MKHKPPAFIQTGLSSVTWISLLSLAVWWRLQNIDAFSLNNDEGAYLMWARLVAEGYPLYSETHSVSAPLFIKMLALGFRLFNFSIVGGRLMILAWFVALAILLAYIAKTKAGWVGAFIALIFAAVLTPFFSLSRQVMGEIPATVLALGAVFSSQGLSTFSQSKPSSLPWFNIGLAGFLLGLSLLMKALYPATICVILYFIWQTQPSWSDKLKVGLVFGFSLGVTILLGLSPYQPDAFFDQAIRFRSDLRASVAWDWQQNWRLFLSYYEALWGLGLLALAGAIVTQRERPTQAWLLWLGLNFILLMWHRPIFFHHFVILLPPLFLLSFEWLAFCYQKKAHRWGWLVVILALGSLPALIQLNQGWVAIKTGGREVEAARILNQVTQPTDFIISDSQLFVLLADRRTPPPLGDIALVAIRAGRQSSERLMALSETYQVNAVAPWALRLPWLPEYLAWVEQNYWVHHIWDNDHKLYFGRKHPPHQPLPNETSLNFDGQILLRGYAIEADVLQPGGELDIKLYWQAIQSLDSNYTVFVQLLNLAEGRLVAQNDRQPLFGYFPTNQWPPHEVIPDLYDLTNLQRLAVPQLASDYVILTTITITD